MSENYLRETRSFEASGGGVLFKIIEYSRFDVSKAGVDINAVSDQVMLKTDFGEYMDRIRKGVYLIDGVEVSSTDPNAP